METSEIIRRNYKLLLRSLNPGDKLLDRLHIDGLFANELPEIRKLTSADARSGRLLSLLCNDQSDAQSTTRAFLSALRACDQVHVANVFEKSSDDIPMSDDHYRMLCIGMKKFRRFVDPDGGLLEQLMSDEAISYDEFERIRSRSTYDDMATETIATLLTKSDDVFRKFIRALRKTGQEHVVRIATGEGPRPMSRKNIDLLSKHRRYLVENIEPIHSYLLDELLTSGVFTENDRQRVLVRSTTEARNDKIVEILRRKSDDSMDQFVSALNGTGHGHIGQMLAGCMVFGTVRVCHGPRCSKEEAVDVERTLHRMIHDFVRLHRNGKHILNATLATSDVSLVEADAGNVVRFRCQTAHSLTSLKIILSSGDLSNLFGETFLPPDVDGDGVTSIEIVVPDTEFDRSMELFRRNAPMTATHRDALIEAPQTLLDTMVVDDDLLSRLALCGRRRRAVRQAPNERERVRTLLGIVARQPDAEFGRLVDALAKTGQLRAARLLDPDYQPAGAVKQPPGVGVSGPVNEPAGGARLSPPASDASATSLSYPTQDNLPGPVNEPAAIEALGDEASNAEPPSLMRAVTMDVASLADPTLADVSTLVASNFSFLFKLFARAHREMTGDKATDEELLRQILAADPPSASLPDSEQRNAGNPTISSTTPDTIRELQTRVQRLEETVRLMADRQSGNRFGKRSANDHKNGTEYLIVTSRWDGVSRRFSGYDPSSMFYNSDIADGKLPDKVKFCETETETGGGSILFEVKRTLMDTKSSITDVHSKYVAELVTKTDVTETLYSVRNSLSNILVSIIGNERWNRVSK